jgi:parvulin-like peptidyl-prolyl isomerase
VGLARTKAKEERMSISRTIGRGLAGALLLAITGVLWAQGTANRAAAVVNGEAIPMVEVEAILSERPSPIPLTAEQQREMRKAALNMLIDDALMRQYLRKAMPAPSQAEVNKEMAELVDVLQKQKKTLDQFLKEGKQTQEQLRADMVSKLQWKAYLQKRLPDASVKAYFDQNKIFFDKVMVRASHILVKLKANATPQERQAAAAKMQAIRQEILTGKIDFAEAAKKYSDCPSKTKGGDIGPFPYKFAVVEPFARAAFSTKVGDVTDVVATDFGLHLIKVTDRTKGEPASFDTIKEGVREVYAQDLDIYQQILAQQRKTSTIELMMK